MTTDYLSGPMSGHPEFNFPVFDGCAAAWKGLGNKAISPADHDRAAAKKAGVADITTIPGYAEGDVAAYSKHLTTLDTQDLLGWDFKAIIDRCDGIIMLPGWEKSTGARYERIVAEATGKTVWIADRLGTDNVGWGFAHDNVGWGFAQDPEQKRLTAYLKGYGDPSTAKAVTARAALQDLRTALPNSNLFTAALNTIEANLA